MSFIAIFVASAIGIVVLVGLAAWARIERPRAPLDRATALALFEEEFPDRPAQAIWIAPGGEAAIARTGESALLACRMGDGYVARAAPWSAVEQAKLRGQTALVRLEDIAAPRARFTLAEDGAWPPRLEAAR